MLPFGYLETLRRRIGRFFEACWQSFAPSVGSRTRKHLAGSMTALAMQTPDLAFWIRIQRTQPTMAVDLYPRIWSLGVLIGFTCPNTTRSSSREVRIRAPVFVLVLFFFCSLFVVGEPSLKKG